MMRFYDVDHGKILLDGIDIRDYDLHHLREMVSLVMQEPIIFNYSILENVLYGKLEASNEEILIACQTANAMGFIESNSLYEIDESAQALIVEMKKNWSDLIDMNTKEVFEKNIQTLEKIMAQERQAGKFESIVGDIDKREDALKQQKLCQGFQTQCGLNGNKLSGGQKQRVAIARTLIRQPKVLLLDEATSALDEESQKEVQKALESSMSGRTTIVIAHRLSTIQNCDKIFVLQSGKVIEEGGFNELKTKGGAFSKLSKGNEEK